jgi:hypothetical protein
LGLEFGNRHDRGINHLAAARNVALRLQMLAKALEQRLNQTGLRKRLSEQPQRRAVRNAVLDAKPQGFEVAQSTVSKYMTRRCGPPSQTCRTFLRNHADAIAAIDLCLVPTLTFECL